MAEAGFINNISAIVPAFNEEGRIQEVISILKLVDLIDEIVVVNDGSTDKTAEVSKNFGARVVNLSENSGKGGALAAGVKSTLSDILLFIDADLIGLKPHHIISLLQPVISGETDMTLGVFTSGRLRTDLSQQIFPFISGQRVLRRSFIEQANDLADSRYGVEICITKHAKRLGIKTLEVHLEDMTHVMKEEKLGYSKGLIARMKMYRDILNYYRADKKTKDQ